MNEFNTITNQLSSIEIDFDDEIRALIILAFLPNSWETMRMAVSNSTGKEKLKYNAGTVGKQVTLKRNAKVLRRRMKMILLML